MSEIAPEVILLDLDRTLYDTPAAFDESVRLAGELDICKASVLRRARKRHEDVELTFDLDDFLLRRRVPPEEVEGLYDTLGENKAGIDFLYPDGRRLLTALAVTKMPAYIKTRGTPPRQIAKLRSAILRPDDKLGIPNLFYFPHIITNDIVKARGVNTSRGPKGEYVAKTKVCLGDLTIRAYRGLAVEDRPEGLDEFQYPAWVGILVRRQQEGSKLRPAQMGVVPPGAMVLPDLDPLTERVYQVAKYCREAGREASFDIGDMVREHLSQQLSSV